MLRFLDVYQNSIFKADADSLHHFMKLNIIIIHVHTYFIIIISTNIQKYTLELLKVWFMVTSFIEYMFQKRLHIRRITYFKILCPYILKFVDVYFVVKVDVS